MTDVGHRSQEDGLDAGERTVLDGFMGKKLYAYGKSPNTGDFRSGIWRDDEPLLLTFEDGTVLRIDASGWHSSGELQVSRG